MERNGSAAAVAMAGDIEVAYVLLVVRAGAKPAQRRRSSLLAGLHLTIVAIWWWAELTLGLKNLLSPFEEG
jgi:hypothetical protein